MIKFLLLGLIVYAYYKFFLKPKSIEGRNQQQIHKHKQEQDEEEGDYVDYEEVE